ncbi:hypothetical protein C9374_009391 [Naegleria lovaniensis]|uniref:Mitochondrial carrier protein n=1 Tax=Naegleria lovaniensis TaxID=51637 RepID=A0AA88GIL8_NAELO|nr:uncharacterized protein C9374_009391 [Naegleria lovaniensis]KAG2377480.1 hypothetical protein C9374_009391 [Naegleria lovaniensis]
MTKPSPSVMDDAPEQEGSAVHNHSNNRATLNNFESSELTSSPRQPSAFNHSTIMTTSTTALMNTSRTNVAPNNLTSHETTSSNLPPSFEITWQNLDKFKYYSIGLAATSTTLALFYPFDLIKTHQQMNSGSSIKQRAIFKNLFKTYGFRGLYKGFAISLLGACSIESLYMSTYEIANQEYLNRNSSNDETNDSLKNNNMAAQRESDSTSFNRYFLAGLSADIIANTLVVPFDVISQRMMISTVKDLSSIHIIRDILNKEGFRGLYRGYAWSLCKFAPESALWWGIYGLLRKKYFESIVIEDSQRNGNQLVKHQLFSSASSGILAGTICAIVFNPLDVIKTRLQTFEQKMTFKQVITELHRSDGLVKGLSKGILPNIIFMASTSSLSITVYELVKILSKTS